MKTSIAVCGMHSVRLKMSRKLKVSLSNETKYLFASLHSQELMMGFKLFKRTNNRIRTIRRSLSRRLSRLDSPSGSGHVEGSDHETRSEQEQQAQQAQSLEGLEHRRNSEEVGSALRQIGDELNNSRLSLNSSRLSLNIQSSSGT